MSVERLLARYRVPDRAVPEIERIAETIAARTTPRPSASDRRELGVPVAGAVERVARETVEVSYRLPARLRADDVLTLAAWDLPPGVILEAISLPAECADRLPRAAMGATGIRERLRLPSGRPTVFMTPTPWHADSLKHLEDAPDLVRQSLLPIENPTSHADVVERSWKMRDILASRERKFLLLGDMTRFWVDEQRRHDFVDREGREARLIAGVAAMKGHGFDGIVVPLAAVGYDVAPQLAEAIGGPVFFEAPQDDDRPWFVAESRTDAQAGIRRFTRDVVFATAARLAGADGLLFSPRLGSQWDERGVITRPHLVDICESAARPLAGLPPLMVVLASTSPPAAAAIRSKRDHIALTAAPGIASPISLRRACGH